MNSINLKPHCNFDFKVFLTEAGKVKYYHSQVQLVICKF